MAQVDSERDKSEAGSVQDHTASGDEDVDQGGPSDCVYSEDERDTD